MNFCLFTTLAKKNWDSHASQTTGACILERARACAPATRGCLIFFGQGSRNRGKGRCCWRINTHDVASVTLVTTFPGVTLSTNTRKTKHTGRGNHYSNKEVEVIHTHTCAAHMYVCTHVARARTHTHTHTRKHTRALTCTHTHTTHTCAAHTHTHKHIHAHGHATHM